MAKPISTLKSPKTVLLKKVLIIAAATAGLIAAGALAVVAVTPDEEDVLETSE